jgi:hypothetical protein
LLVLGGCADWQRPALTSPYRANEPLIQEQALVGVAADGSAAAVQLVDAEGAPPRLELIVLDARGGATRHLAAAAGESAGAVSRRLRADGGQPAALLGAIARDEWRDGLVLAAREGFMAIPPAPPDALPSAVPASPPPPVRESPPAGESPPPAIAGSKPSRAPHAVPPSWWFPATQPDAPPLRLRVALSHGDPPAFTLLLGAPGEDAVKEVELARQPIAGTPVEGGLWKAGDTVWFLSGSVGAGEPLRRAIGLRRASIRRGEAELHNSRGLSLRGAHDFAGAVREFDRAVAADARFVEPLYNAATTAALSGREQEAVIWLRRAAEVDRRRVQVLGRTDDALRALRQRADVREILGMKRAPSETSN